MTNSSWNGKVSNEGPIGLPPELFAEAFPFHFVFDDKLRIVQVGRSLRIVEHNAVIDARLDECFELTRPIIDFSFANLDSLFVFTGKTGEVPTRGQLAAVGDRLLCMGSPWLTEPKGLKELGLTFDDFAIHDSMVDLLQVVQG